MKKTPRMSNYVGDEKIQSQSTYDNISGKILNQELDLESEQKRIPTSDETKIDVNVVTDNSIQLKCSLQDVIQSFVNDNSSITSFASTIKHTHSNISIDNTDSTFDDNDNKKDKYELTTGIDKDVPEVIMMTGFVPLIDNENVLKGSTEVNLTDAGRVFLDKLGVSEVNIERAQRTLKNISKRSPQISRQISTNATSTNTHIQKIVDTMSFMTALLKNAESLKQSFDLKSTKSSVTKKQQKTDKTSRGQTKSIVESRLGNVLSIKDALIESGAPEKNVSNYTSTKLWVQLVNEFKKTASTCSLKLCDEDANHYVNDNHPTNIVYENKKRFALSEADKDTLPTLKSLLTIQPTQLNATIKTIAMHDLYDGKVPQNIAEEAAAIATVITQEFKYSQSLATKSTQHLFQTYGYSIKTNADNKQFWDYVVGSSGRNITSIEKQSDKTLVSLTVNGTIDKKVLTFEETFIKNNSYAFIPGTEYYVDSIFDVETKGNSILFNSQNLKKLSKELSTTYSTLQDLLVDLKIIREDETTLTRRNAYESMLLSADSLIDKIFDVLSDDDEDKPTKAAKELTKTLENSTSEQTDTKNTRSRNTNSNNHDQIFTRGFVDRRTESNDVGIKQQRKQQQTDVSLLLFALSSKRKSVKLRSLLFLYMMLLAFNDSSSAISGIEKEIINEFNLLIGEMPAVTKTNSNDVIEITSEQIVTTFRSKTSLIKEVSKLIQNIYSALKESNVIKNERTIYSYRKDTHYLYSIFDLIVLCYSKANNYTLLGKATAKNKQTLLVNMSKLDIDDIQNDIISSIKNEQAYVQMLANVILSTVKSLRSKIDNFITFLESDSAKSSLTLVSNTLNDVDLIKMLFSKHQLSLALSVFDEIGYKSKKKSNIDDRLNSLETSYANDKYKDALLTYFSQPEFSTGRAYNKRILTIGIPVGFAERFRKEVQLSNKDIKSFDIKQSDIIAISVYKVDLLRQSIVWKPITFKFELSRLNVREDDHLPASFPKIGREFYGRFPTKDDSQAVNKFQYGTPSSNQLLALSGDGYEFIASKTRDEIIKNHVSSLLLEAYIKVLTGVDTNENDFLIKKQIISTDKQLRRDIVDSLSEHVITGTSTKQKTFFTSSNKEIKRQNESGEGSSKQSSSLTKQPLRTFSRSQVQSFVEHLENASAFTNMLTNQSSLETIGKKIFTPRMFDRIFNVIIDSDEFIVDESETLSTRTGKSVFARLIKTGDFVQISDNVTNRVQYRFRDRNDDDVLLDKYFVVVSAVEEGKI